jgi:hypothetical protein
MCLNAIQEARTILNIVETYKEVKIKNVIEEVETLNKS